MIIRILKQCKRSCGQIRLITEVYHPLVICVLSALMVPYYSCFCQYFTVSSSLMEISCHNYHTLFFPLVSATKVKFILFHLTARLICFICIYYHLLFCFFHFILYSHISFIYSNSINDSSSL